MRRLITELRGTFLTHGHQTSEATSPSQIPDFKTFIIYKQLIHIANEMSMPPESLRPINQLIAAYTSKLVSSGIPNNLLQDELCLWKIHSKFTGQLSTFIDSFENDVKKYSGHIKKLDTLIALASSPDPTGTVSKDGSDVTKGELNHLLNGWKDYMAEQLTHHQSDQQRPQ